MYACAKASRYEGHEVSANNTSGSVATNEMESRVQTTLVAALPWEHAHIRPLFSKTTIFGSLQEGLYWFYTDVFDERNEVVAEQDPIRCPSFTNLSQVDLACLPKHLIEKLY